MNLPLLFLHMQNPQKRIVLPLHSSTRVADHYLGERMKWHHPLAILTCFHCSVLTWTATSKRENLITTARCTSRRTPRDQNSSHSSNIDLSEASFLRNSRMQRRLFASALLWLFYWPIHVSAIHRMVEYVPFEDQFGLVGRQGLECPAATETVCPDGNGCCSSGAACYTSNGVGLCSQPCSAAAVTCTINNVVACCDVGQDCSPSGCVAGSNSASVTLPTSAKSSTTAAPANKVGSPTITSSPTPSLTCGTDLACIQGSSIWCCIPTMACDYSSPGFCLEPITATASSTAQNTLPTSESALTTSRTSAAPAVFTAAASGTFELNDWNSKIWTLVAALSIAIGLL